MPANVFLKLDDLKGGSRDKNHKDQIDVLAWSWGLSQGISSGIGSSRKKVNVEDLSITKYIDKASPGLIRAVCSGKVFKEALLTLSNSGEKLIDYYKVTFNDLVIFSVTAGGNAGEDQPTENITLKYAKFKVEYTPQKSNEKSDAVVEAVWDLSENAK